MKKIISGFLKIRNFIENNKVVIEIIITIFFGYMAIKVANTQNQISMNQEELLRIQTSFLYTPNLKIKLENQAHQNYSVVLSNDGRSNIINTEIFIHLGIYFTYNNDFIVSLRSTAPWNDIRVLNPDSSKEIVIDTSDAA